MRRIFLVMFVIVLAACGKSGGGGAPAPTTTRAAATQRIGPRVVSTVPAATLNLVLIGGADTLVGVSEYDRLLLPEEKQGLPVVGDYKGINYERLVGLKPTAVIVQTSEPRIKEKLKDLGAAEHFEIMSVKLETTEDLWETVKTLGRISGREDAATAAVRKAQGELKEIAETLKGKEKPRVLYVISKDPMYVVGSNTILDEMITLAGGKNVAAEIGRSWPVISNETLVKLWPEVLLVGAPEESEQQANDPRLEKWMRYDVPAVKEKRVFLVTDGDSQMASVNIGKHVRELAEMIHRGDEKRETRNAKRETEEATPGGKP